MSLSDVAFSRRALLALQHSITFLERRRLLKVRALINLVNKRFQKSIRTLGIGDAGEELHALEHGNIAVTVGLSIVPSLRGAPRGARPTCAPPPCAQPFLSTHR